MRSSRNDEPVLGVTPGSLSLENTQEIRDTGCSMASQTRRELLLFGQTLDAELYDHRAFLAPLQRLALSHPHLPVRVLTADPRRTARNEHRLIDLARTLTSRIEIRRICTEDQERVDAFLVADECGYITRRLADTMVAMCDFHAPGEARRLKAEFDQIWSRATSDPNLRRLFI